jgi:hypothetical protein
MTDLATFPDDLRRIAEQVPAEQWTYRIGDTFALVEQAWHLADLEVEGYGERLRRILAEDSPVLPDFRGDLAAIERDYIHQPLTPALDRFATARANNLALIASATEEQQQRTGVQEGVGTVTFARVVEMMRAHDAGHASELAELCKALGQPARSA